MVHRAGVGILCALAAAALYGLVPNFAKGAFDNGVPTVESVLYRTTLLVIVFSMIAALQKQALRVPQPAKASFTAQAIATLLVSLGYIGSIQFIPVGLAVIIFYVFPVLIMIAAPMVEGQNPGIVRILIALFAFAGLVIAIGPSLESLDIRGILLAVAGAGGAALQAFSGRSLSQYMLPSAFGSLVHAAIWPVILVAAIIAGGGYLHSLPGGSVSSAGLLFALALCLIYVTAYMIQMLSLRFAPASTIAPFCNLEPVVTIVVAVLVLGETMQFNQYAGGAMVLAALIASSLIDLGRRG